MSVALPAGPRVAVRPDRRHDSVTDRRDIDAMLATEESTVSLRVVRGLVEVVEQAGVSRAAFLRAGQLRPEQLAAADDRVPRAKIYEMCELAIDLTADPAFGLHWAERFRDGAFAPVSHLIDHAPSLRQGFASLAQFSRLFSDDRSHELIEGDSLVKLRIVRSPGESALIQRFLAEMIADRGGDGSGGDGPPPVFILRIFSV